MDTETGHDLESQGRRCGVEVEPERQGRGEDCALEEEISGTRYLLQCKCRELTISIIIFTGRQ